MCLFEAFWAFNHFDIKSLRLASELGDYPAGMANPVNDFFGNYRYSRASLMWQTGQAYQDVLSAHSEFAVCAMNLEQK